MDKGQVVKTSSSKYWVLSDNSVYACSARGTLKNKNADIVTGDYVMIDKASLTIERVLDRSSFFIRPSVANVDAVNIVIASPPKPDYLMLDKLLLSFISQNVEVIMSVNKSDLSGEIYQEVADNYSEVGCKILPVSATTGEGISSLKNLLKGKLVVFAGQSAVGKSSLVNSLFGLRLKTNDVSEKTQRGRHTTTAAQIYEFEDIRVVDTPGFSVIDPDISAEEVALFYPEYFSRLPNCKFRCCTHIGEPGCKVIEEVSCGKLNKDRYNRYKTIYNEIKSKKIIY